MLASQFAMRSLSSNETVLGWSSCAAPTDHCAASHNETRPRATQEFTATGLNISFFLFHFISSNASVLAVLPTHAEDHDAVPTTCANVREGPARSVESAEV